MLLGEREADVHNGWPLDFCHSAPRAASITRAQVTTSKDLTRIPMPKA
jgi:hypothetical protein